ncbi:hypothetical protein D3C72_1301930 [compost metagenome]
MPFRLTVTTVLSARLLAPLRVSGWPFSMAFSTLSTAISPMVSVGATVFTVTSLLALPTLPALSVRVTDTVLVPSVSAPITLAGTPTLQFPAASTVVV